MKTRKMLMLSVSMLIISLFITPTSNALTTHTVDYPTSVKLGETFTVNIVFNYGHETNCLYGLYVWLHLMINDEITSSWTSGLTKYIYTFEDYPRPTNVTWSFDTLVMAHGTLETDDIIKFRIKYKTGYDTGYIVYFEGIIVTPSYEITIGEETSAQTNAISITIPILVLLVSLILTRIPKREGLK